MTDTRKTITILRARLQDEQDKPWFYFFGDKHLPLSHAFVNLGKAIHTQKCVLVDKSVMDRASKKQLRKMFDKLVGLQRIYSLTGLEIEFITGVTPKERPDGLTPNKYCIRRTNAEAAEWLISNGYSSLPAPKPMTIDTETVNALAALSKT